MYLMLRQEREKKDWTLNYVAEQTGTTKSTIQMLETGKRKPSYEVLVKLEDLFQRNHRQLFAVVDDKVIIISKTFEKVKENRDSRLPIHIGLVRTTDKVIDRDIKVVCEGDKFLISRFACSVLITLVTHH